jgi:hypothetical protein
MSLALYKRLRGLFIFIRNLTRLRRQSIGPRWHYSNCLHLLACKVAAS